MTADIHTLAAAYALDALDGEEQRFFERHLAECAACQAEVAEMRETSAVLGAAAAEMPPPSLKTGLMAQVDVTRQQAPLPPTAPEPTLRERLAPVLGIAAGVLALAVLGLGALVVHLGNRVENLETQLADLGTDMAVLPVLTAPDSQVVQLTLVEGAGTARFLYSTSLDQGFLVVDGLQPLGQDEVYEIWTFHDSVPVPAGIFEIDEQGRAVTSVDGTVAGAELVAVTVEPRGGLPEPEGPVVLQSEEL